MNTLTRWALCVVTLCFFAMSSLAQLVIPNPNPVNISASDSVVTPYPSEINITGTTGVVERVAVILGGVTHSYPDDLDVLLVSPSNTGNTNILLMSDAGGSFPVNGVNLTFSGFASGSLPNDSQIVSGAFLPSNFADSDADTFASPAPAGPYTGALADLNGKSANGRWKLYVSDDALGDGGSIASWSLSIWTSTILTVTNASNTVNTDEDTPVTVKLKVINSSTPNVTVTATSQNTTALPNANLSISGTGEDRILTITPKKDFNGTVLIDVKATTAVGQTTLTLTLNVAPVNDPTILTLSTNKVTLVQGTAGSVTATNTAVAQETIAGTEINVVSSNPAIVTGYSTAPAGTAIQTVNIVPTGAATGTATLTVQAIDKSSGNVATYLTNSLNVDVTINPAAYPVFGNPTNIVVAAGATASSASSVTVSNVNGNIGKLTVVLNGITAAQADELNAVLVGPTGAKVALVSDKGGTGALDRVRLTFDDAAANSLTEAAITSGTYKPSSDSTPNVVSPAPADPYSVTLDAFNNTSANGTWTLYVYNEAGGALNIGGGFVLNIRPGPFIPTITTKTTLEDTKLEFLAPVSDMDGSITNLTLSTFSSVVTGTAVLTTNSGVVSAKITLNPVENENGDTVVTLIATDNSGFKATNSFTLTITPVNDLPEVSVIQKQETPAGVPVGPISFTVSDVETAASSLIITASSDNTTLLPNSNIVLGGSDGNRTVTLYPAGAQTGIANVSIRVQDGTGGTTVQTFKLTVLPAENPLFESGAAITVNDASTATPYPSTISVSGLVGVVAEVKVTLSGITHPSPEDLDVLLVGPGGTPVKVVLLSDAGGTADVAGTQLILADSATASVGSPLISGTFKPTDVNSGADTFPSPAPASPYSSTLAAFNGIVPNGDWRLYVVDDSNVERGGIISGGWTLSIRTAPIISPIPQQETNEDEVKTVRITIGDAQSGVNLVVTATTNNSPTPNLVKSIDITGTGASRTLTITPNDNVFGTNTITVSVTDGVNTDTESFLFIVRSLNDAPTISAIANQTTPAATELGPINFTVGDVETAAGSLTVTATAQDPSLIDTMTLGGSGANRTLTILPSGVKTGSTLITVTVTDGTGQKATRTFTLTVAPNLAFANGSRIVIADVSPGNTPAQPFPSIIPVSGVQGKVSKATVILIGFSHPFPDDVDMVLVAPDGKKSALMSDAGNGTAVNNLRITFADSAAGAIPDESAITAGAYKPANYTDTVEGNETTLGSGSPAGPYTASMANFANAEPNGEWKLYIRDDTFPDGGSIEGGWILLLETGPLISSVPTQTTPEDTNLVVPFTLQDSDTAGTNLVVTIAIDSTTAPFRSGVLQTVTNNPVNPASPFDRSVTIVPALNQTGTNKITLTVTDGTTSASTSFNIRVTPVDDSPTIATATNKVIIAEDNITTTIAFTIGDVDSTVGISNVVVTSSNTQLIPNGSSGLVLSGNNGITAGNTGTATVLLKPATNQFGTTEITFSLTDRNTTVTTNITVQVDPVNDVPTMTALTNQTVIAGSTTTVQPFTIGDVETPARNLVVTATSSDQALVPNENIILGGGAESKTIQVTTIGVSAGTAVISVVVSDGTASITNSYNVVLTKAGDVFGNSTPITIRDANTAQPYPSTVAVSGMRGGINNVKVTIDGFSHSAPDDVDMLLVSPTGKKILLLSDTGGRNPVSNLRLTFDQSGAVLGDDAPLVTGIYQPSNFEAGDVLAGAPAGPYTNTLAQLRGDDANGNWSLYIVDDTANDSGQIAFGWSLLIDTVPTIVVNTATPVIISEDSFADVQFTIDDMNTPLNSLQLTFSSSNPTLLPTGNITVTRAGASVTARLTPVADASGTNNLTVTVRRTTDGASSTIVVPMSVTPVNDLPTISRLTEKTTVEDKPISFDLIVADVDTPNSNIWVEVTSSNTAVISNTNAVLQGTTNLLKGIPSNLLTLTLKPNANATGTSEISVVVSDRAVNPAATVTSTFTFTVAPVNDPPIIGAGSLTNRSILSGSFSGEIPFTVSDPENNTLTITATSSDQTVVANSSIVIGGSGGSRTISFQAVGGKTTNETTTITIVVTDNGSPVASTQASFVVTSRPTRERVFSSTRPIEIVDNNIANPYPSTINVADLVGNLTKVTVTINGLTHRFPDDIDMLLVGPGGQKVVLMSDAGGGVSVSGINLKFDADAASTIPDSTLAAGTYKPANHESNTDVFPSPAPAGPYSSSALTDFNGVSPNGTWSLYVVDDTPSDAGAITNGWALTLTTEPVIVGLVNQTVPEDTSARQAFTVIEEGFASTAFTFSASSTNTALVPNANIVVTGSGTNWTVTATPAENASGTTEITLTLTNPDLQSISKKYSLTVTPVNDAPIVTAVADQTLTAGSVSQGITFNYSDVETDKKNLTLTVTSSNEALLPVSNITVVGNELRIVTQGTATGTSTVSLTVSDGALSTTSTFLVTIVPSINPFFANTNSIVIVDNAKANPYPSTIDVTGVSGKVVKVTVTLSGLTHVFPDDVDILLVGPAGQKVVLMSDAGGGTALSDARITIDDSAAIALPDTTAIDAFGTYKPANYEGNETFATPAPAGPYATTLAAFANTDPNGTWSLYVMDDQSPDAGTIAKGWSLSIVTTAPVISQIGDVTVVEDTPKNIVFTVQDGDTASTNLTVTATSDDPTLVAVSVSGTDSTRTITLTPAANASGRQTQVHVTVSDGSNVTTTAFNVTVTPVNDAPTISGLTDTNTPLNVRLRVPFTVADIETPVTNIVVAASSSDTAVATVAVEFDETSQKHTLVINPREVSSVGTVVTVTATDGELTTTKTILVKITPPIGPTITAIPNQTVNEDTVAHVTFTVVASSANVQVTAAASNPALVSAINVNGGAGTADIVLVPNASGTSEITITATDDFGTAQSKFTLTVLPAADAPQLAAIADQSGNEDTTITIPLTVTDVDTTTADLTFTGSSSNPTLVSGITFDKSGSPVLANINLGTNRSGFAAVTITVTDKEGLSSSRTFALEVRPVDDPPVLPVQFDLFTDEDQDITFNVVVSDVDTDRAALQVTGSTTTPNLVQSVTITRSGDIIRATVDVVPDASGTAIIVITAKDSVNTVSREIRLIITPVDDAPVFGTIPNQTSSGGPVTVTIPITDVDTDLASIGFSARTKTTPSLVVSSVTFSNDGSQVRATITPFAGAAGSEEITIVAREGSNEALATFTFTVSSAPPVLELVRAGAGFTLNIKGTSGSTVTVERSTDLINWGSPTNVTLDANGNGTLAIPQDGALATFFRTRN